MTEDSLAFVFPGQGSQSVGMLADLGDRPEIRETFDEAAHALGYDLWSLIQSGPVERLDQTEFTQPAMLAAGVAMWRAWQAEGGPLAGWMAGHSLGEYTALVCAGSLGFTDGLQLVAERGRLMQSAVPAGSGAMAAILGLDDESVRAACVDAAQGAVVAAVNFNAPGQVVIAGDAGAVARAVDIAKARGARRAVALPVSVPSHCALMRPAAEALAPRLAATAFDTPGMRVVHNADVAVHAAAPAIRDALVRQLYSPVRWVETMQHMAANGVTQVVECGPGKVLAGLTKRIDKGLVAHAIADQASLAAARSTFGEG